MGIQKVSRRLVLATAGAAAALPLVRARAAVSNGGPKVELTTTTGGGSFEQAWRKVVFDPFEAAHPNIGIRTVTALSSEAASLARAQRNDVKIDILTMDQPMASEIAPQNVYQPLNVSTVPNLNMVYPEFRVKGDVYATIYYYAMDITYDTDKIKGVPQSWRDLWNPEYKGLITVPDITTSQGPMFLLQLALLNGGSIENIEPGFAALKTLKPNIVTFWTQHAQVAEMFTQGQIVMAAWIPDRTDDLIESGGHVAWTIPREKAVQATSTMGIAKGSKHLVEAAEYVNFVLGLTAQTGIANTVNLCPTNKTVKITPAISAKIPAGPEELKKMIPVNWAALARELPKWVDQWNREIAS